MYITAFITRHLFLRFHVIESLFVLREEYSDYFFDYEPVKIYDKQLYDNVFDYDYYKVIATKEDDEFVLEAFVCIRKDDENETVNE